MPQIYMLPEDRASFLLDLERRSPHGDEPDVPDEHVSPTREAVPEFFRPRQTHPSDHHSPPPPHGATHSNRAVHDDETGTDAPGVTSPCASSPPLYYLFLPTLHCCYTLLPLLLLLYINCSSLQTLHSCSTLLPLLLLYINCSFVTSRSFFLFSVCFRLVWVPLGFLFPFFRFVSLRLLTALCCLLRYVSAGVFFTTVLYATCTHASVRTTHTPHTNTRSGASVRLHLSSKQQERRSADQQRSAQASDEGRRRVHGGAAYLTASH